MTNNYPNLFETTKIQELLDAGLVRVQKHPDADLWIWNYTQAAQFGGQLKTDYVLRQLRGMITDQDGQVVARGFPKFFNLGEQPEVDAAYAGKEFRAETKYDGSLGILYHDGTDYAIATRGSFLSEQAIEGTKILKTLLQESPSMREGFDFFRHKAITILYEILYPENRIVVDYKGVRELVLLGYVDNRTGKNANYGLSGGLLHSDPSTLLDVLPNPGNQEGFVLVYPDSHRVKVKYAEYCRLHRIVTGLNELAVWEALASNSLDSLIESCPDEFFNWVKNVSAKFKSQFNHIDQTSQIQFAQINQSKFATKGEMARHIADWPDKALYFALWDGKASVYTRNIWNSLRPVGVTPGPFNGRDEA